MKNLGLIQFEEIKDILIKKLNKEHENGENNDETIALLYTVNKEIQKIRKEI